MKDILAVTSFLIAISLVVVDLVVAVVSALKPKSATIETVNLMAGERVLAFPSGDIIKALTDKAPRLGAALAFMILAGIFSGVLEFTASATSN